MAKRKNPDYLLLHKNDQYYRKLRGKHHYFGSEPVKAKELWGKEKKYLLVGETPPPREGKKSKGVELDTNSGDPRPTITELANLFFHDARKRVALGPGVKRHLSARSLAEYENTLARLISIVGANQRVEDISPLDWDRIREELHNPVVGKVKRRTVKRRSLTTVGGDIRRIRSFLAWCLSAEQIKAKPRYGQFFDASSCDELRQQRQAAGRLDYDATELQSILAKAKPTMKAILLLAVKSGMGSKDLARLELKHFPTLIAMMLFLTSRDSRPETPGEFICGNRRGRH